jgi:hypothetical protein
MKKEQVNFFLGLLCGLILSYFIANSGVNLGISGIISLFSSSDVISQVRRNFYSRRSLSVLSSHVLFCSIRVIFLIFVFRTSPMKI